MMMNKNVKLIAGVVLVGAAGYLLWQQSQKKSFANATAKATAKLASMSSGMADICPCAMAANNGQGQPKEVTVEGETYIKCQKGHLCPKSAGTPVAVGPKA